MMILKVAFSKRLLLLCVFAAAAVMVVLVYKIYMENSAKNRLSPQAAELFELCLSDTNDVASRVVCAEEWFRTGKTSDFTEALDIIHSLNATAAIVGSQCHKFEHVAVKAVLDNNGKDIDTILKACDEAYSCGGGCFHSAMTEAVLIKGTSDEMVKTLTNLCLNTVHEERDLASCFHGIGHGFIAASMDLLKSLTLCYNVNDNPVFQKSCYSGVFRAAALPSLISGHHPSYFKAGDPFYPCKEVPEKFQAECYADAGERAVEAGNAINEALEVCSQVPKETWATSCRRTLYIIEVRKAIYPKEKHQTCKSFGQYEKECYAAVSFELFNTPYAKSMLSAFCDGLNENEREACKHGSL